MGDLLNSILIWGVIIYILYWVATHFFGLRQDSKVEKIIQEKVEDLEKKKNNKFKSKYDISEYIPRLEREIKDISQQYDNYLRLKEKYGPLSFIKQRKLDFQWASYVSAWSKIRENYYGYGVLEGKQLDNLAKDDYKAQLRIEELSKNFGRQLKTA